MIIFSVRRCSIVGVVRRRPSVLLMNKIGVTLQRPSEFLMNETKIERTVS